MTRKIVYLLPRLFFQPLDFFKKEKKGRVPETNFRGGWDTTIKQLVSSQCRMAQIMNIEHVSLGIHLRELTQQSENLRFEGPLLKVEPLQ